MVAEFRDTEGASDHDRFQAWRTEHQDGVFLTLETETRGNLHGARCGHLGSGPPYFLSDAGRGSLTSKAKICASQLELIDWAAKNGVDVNGCKHCLRDGLVGAVGGETDLDAQVAEAEAVMVGVVPDQNGRLLVMRRLLRSVAVAQSVAPGAWAVTLFSDGFCLNVGQVEVLVLAKDVLRVNLSAELGALPFAGPRFLETTYRSMKSSQCAFVGAINDYGEVEGAIGTAHETFVSRAASTQSGEGRKGTRYRSSHHEGILEFARRVLQESDETEPQTWSPNEEIPVGLADPSFKEGGRVVVQVNAFERSRRARDECIARHGRRCVVCDFSFEESYGPSAKGYIHVHHLKPLASIGREYVVDPVFDLRPVCANCHAVIHCRTPPYEVSEVVEMLQGTERARRRQAGS